MFLRLFRIKASKNLEKSLAGAIYKEEKWGNGDKKKLLTIWECLNHKKSSLQSPSCVIATRLAVLENVFAIILLWATKDVEKRFEETVYKYNKERPETKSSAWELKNA